MSEPIKTSPLSPERWAKIREHAKLGAHCVATLADVEALQAEIDLLNKEVEDLADQLGEYKCTIHESFHGRY